jgi:hypothetical protein
MPEADWTIRDQLTLIDVPVPNENEKARREPLNPLVDNKSENAGNPVTRIQQLRILSSTCLVAFTVIGPCSLPTQVLFQRAFIRTSFIELYTHQPSRIHSIFRRLSSPLWSPWKRARGCSSSERHIAARLDLHDRLVRQRRVGRHFCCFLLSVLTQARGSDQVSVCRWYRSYSHRVRNSSRKPQCKESTFHH